MATLDAGGKAMRQVSLREFRTRGSKALETVPQGETVLLAGQQGPAFFLIPVMGDVAAEDRELRRAIAKSSLRQYAQLAKAFPVSDEEIEQEIATVRAERQTRLGNRQI
jgi:antitoxin (DNA-binding transcriptional repressor) of toxin-antitoxin stability system